MYKRVPMIKFAIFAWLNIVKDKLNLNCQIKLRFKQNVHNK